jgi:cytochrome P450
MGQSTAVRPTAPFPPGPRGRLLTGTAANWREHTLEFLQSLVRQHGPAVRFHYAYGLHAFLFVHPAHYRRILVENQRNYTKRHPLYDIMRILLGDGLVTSDGDRWLAHRRLMQPAFHASALTALDDIIVRRTTDMLNRWDAELEGPDGTIVELDREMMALTLGVVGDALFGQSLTPHTRQVDTAFSSFNGELRNIVARPFTFMTVRHRITGSSRRLHAAASALRSIVDRVIAARSAAPTERPPGDLLGLLMAARDEETGAILDHDGLRDQVLTLMLAGHETSATALTWTFHLLGEHPGAEARVVDELRRVLGDRVPGIRDLESLPVTRAVAQEALRLYPPIYAFSRQATDEDVIGGYRVPAGAAISLSPYVTHRMPELWDAPERFLPERFLPPAPPPERFAFIPFSAGPRGCIGERFAMTEIVLVLALILRRYRLRPRAGDVVTPLPLVTLRPAGGMPMIRTRVT